MQTTEATLVDRLPSPIHMQPLRLNRGIRNSTVTGRCSCGHSPLGDELERATVATEQRGHSQRSNGNGATGTRNGATGTQQLEQPGATGASNGDTAVCFASLGQQRSEATGTQQRSNGRSNGDTAVCFASLGPGSNGDTRGATGTQQFVLPPLGSEGG